MPLSSKSNLLFARWTLTLVLLAGLALPTVSAAQIPFETIATPRKAYVRAGTIEIARSAEELAALWPRIMLGSPPPAVDFHSRMVVIYFMGPRPFMGNRVEVDGVQIRAGTMFLHVQQWESCGGGQMTQALAVVISTIRWPGGIEADVVRSGCVE